MTLRLVLRVLGWPVLDVELGPAAVELDPAADLSGGELGSTIISAGDTPLHMGFTNGLEVVDRGRQAP